MDILLDQSIDGERYYMILKDFSPTGALGYRGAPGARNIRIRGGTPLGAVEGGGFGNNVGETGLHVTLLPASHYNQFVYNIQHDIPSPLEWFMDAARDPRSP